MRALAVLALAALLAGCTTPAAPVVQDLLPAPAPQPPAVPAPLAMKDCRGSLHVWFVPIDELAKQLPADFPPLPSRSPTAPPGSGQLEFHVIDCQKLSAQHHDTAAPAALGLLAARVTPKEKGLAENATAYYTLHVFTRGHAAEELANWSGMPWSEAEFTDTASSVPGLDLPTYDLALDGDQAGGFTAKVQGAQPEKYEGAFRAFFEKDNATRALDFGISTTLWEGAGSADFSDASVFGKYVPTAAKLSGDHHVLVAAQGTLAAHA